VQYEGAYYFNIGLSAHNNYVDLFAHGGIVGLGLFLWFMTELALLQARLRKHYPDGFTGGYVNGMLAAWFAIMTIMVLADWFLPFVYNIGFGFQSASSSGCSSAATWPRTNGAHRRPAGARWIFRS
jgi:hypothetical protein